MGRMTSLAPLPVYIAKGSRVYVSGLLSVMLPAYLKLVGYDSVFVTVALTAILAGGAISNISLTYFDRVLGRRRLLLVFSLLMAISGTALALSYSSWVVVLACLAGNISTTGTEAGPFQSVEAGVLPDLVGEGRAVRAFGVYNLIGYTASALGAFTLYVPGSLGNDLVLFRALFLVYGFVGVLLFFLYLRLRGIEATGLGSKDLSRLSPEAKSDVKVLAGLFSMDAFGGSFVSQYLLSYWFGIAFGVPTTEIAIIFLVTNVISAVSTYGASFLGEKFGNLRTMVYTHIVSSSFLLLMAVSSTLTLAVAFLFLRQSCSQMDVPTRQALMTEMFARDDRVAAYAITNTVRSGGAFLGGPASSLIFQSGAVVGILYAGGLSKIAYDLLTYFTYRRRFR